MKVIEPTYEILSCPTGEEATKLIEQVGRTCYQSHDRTDGESHLSFCRRMIDSGHHAMIEFGGDITVKFTSNRGFLAEITRHRLCSFAAESTRYCNYSKNKFGNEITVVHLPTKNLLPKGTCKEQMQAYEVYLESLEQAEQNYMKLLKMKVPAEIAREVLPIGVRSIVNVKGNIREWRHILKLRTSKKAHPRMRELMIPLLAELNTLLPVLFEDL